jgi:putative spermidine/putrescine transport system permease protein
MVDKPVRLMGNSIGVLIGMTHIMLPFLVLPLYAGMQRIDDRLVVAAASMGAPQGTIFRRVFLPLSLPGLAAGSLLVFALSVGFYVTPALLGGRTAFYTLLIDMQVNRLLDFGFGSTLAIILLLVVLLIVGLGSRLVRLDQVFGRPGGA